MISCIMSVYNGEPFLREAIDSILGQTYPDFEFIIIDDASTDSSHEIISSYGDKRIRLVTNSENLGLTRSLNKGLELANGQFIARMDADDVSFPTRFAAEIKCLINNPNINLVADTQHVFYVPSKKMSSKEIDIELLFHNCIVHSSVMFRSHIEGRRMLYDENFKRTQDYALWTTQEFKNSKTFVGEQLVAVRRHEGQISQSSFLEQNQYKLAVLRRLFSELEIEATDSEVSIHERISSPSPGFSQHFVSEAVRWLNSIVIANNRKNVYDSGLLRKRVKKQLVQLLKANGLHRSSKLLLLKKILSTTLSNVV